MPRQLREILASVRETGDRGRNTGAPGKYGRSGNPIGGFGEFGDTYRARRSHAFLKQRLLFADR